MALIDLSGQVSPPPPAASKLLAECARKAATANLSVPAPPSGIPELRAELARLLGTTMDRIAVTSGVRGSAAVLAPMLRNVVVETPSFSGVPEVLANLGCNVARQTWDQIGAALEDARPVWITSPCRNPDGATATSSWLARVAASRRSMVVVNEVYRFDVATELSTLPDSWTAVGALSKTFGPAARMGWIRGPLVRHLPSSILRITSPPPAHQHTWAAFAAAGGMRLLAEGAAAGCAAARAFRGAVAGEIDLMSGDGVNVLARLPDAMDVGRLVDELFQHDLKVSPGKAFDVPFASIRLTFTNVSPQEAADAGRSFCAVVRALRYEHA